MTKIKVRVVKHPLAYERRYIRKFFSNLERRAGRVGDRYVRFVYNEDAPERSKILVKPIKE